VHQLLYIVSPVIAASSAAGADTGTAHAFTHTQRTTTLQVIDSLKKQDKVILAIVRHDDRLQRAAAAEADLNSSSGDASYTGNSSSTNGHCSLAGVSGADVSSLDDEVCAWTRALRRNINERRTLCMDAPLPPGTSLLTAMGTVNIGTSSSTASSSAQRRKSHRRSTSSSDSSVGSSASSSSVSKKDMGKGWRAMIVRDKQQLQQQQQAAYQQHEQQQHSHHHQQQQQQHGNSGSSSSSRAGTAEAPPLKLVLADIFE
jgi:hypothetical protein